MATSPFMQDIISPIQAGANMALARQASQRQAQQLAEEIRATRELEKYRGESLGFQAMQEQRLGQDFMLRQKQEERLARAAAAQQYRQADEDYRRAKVLENIQGETQSILSAMPPDAAPEMRREAELTGMARGLFKSGMETEGVGVLKQLSAEKMAAVRGTRMKEMLKPESIEVGGANLLWNPVTGKAEENPMAKAQRERDAAVTKQAINNVESDLKELYLQRADIVKANKTDRQSTQRLEAINSMISQRVAQRNELTQKLHSVGGEVVPVESPTGTTAPEAERGPLGGLWDRWEAFTRGQTP